MVDKIRRQRRTAVEIENDILQATRELIEEVGFTGLTLRGVAKKAGIEARVFYNRYKNLSELLEHFTERYDYWYSGMIASFDDADMSMYPQYAEQLFTTLSTALHENKSMQQILIWELVEDNHITRRTNEMREKNTAHLVEGFGEYFKRNGIDFNIGALASVFIGAIYFLVMHKGKATFCGIDFSTEEGRNLLNETIKKLISMVFYRNKETIEIAMRMKEKGIDQQTIAECTKLPETVVASL